MNKRIYISPSAFVCEISGKPILSATSIVIVGGEGKINSDSDIGFIKEQNPQISDINLWDDEW